jgi:hypothetical protein
MSVDTKHYDIFMVKLSKEEIKAGEIRLDPYRVAFEWDLGVKDPSGCLFHKLKTMSRFGVKEGNSIEREIASLEATLKRLKELHARTHT